MDTVLLNALISLCSAILVAAVTYLLSQRRYRFEKLFDRKPSYLEEIYGKIISLEKDLRRYVHTTGAELSEASISRRREQIAPIQEKFFDLQQYFWQKEILLDETVVTSIQSFIDTSIEVLAKLQTSIVSSRIVDGSTAFNQWRDAYTIVDKKLESAKRELKKDFRKSADT